MDEKKLSRFLSLVLRHRPDEIGIELDSNGWTDVKTLLRKLNGRGMDVKMSDLKNVVKNNDKQRFAFNSTETEIRASQGHSAGGVEVEYEKTEPPSELFHGTSTDALQLIHRSGGLDKMKRHHVHLSATKETATKVGSRHGKPVVIIIAAKQMHDDGHNFYKSANGVWLTDAVPAEYFKDKIF